MAGEAISAVSQQFRTRAALSSQGDCPVGIAPELWRILGARQVGSGSEIDYRLDRLMPLDALRNLGDAATLLAKQVETKKRILIFGDYDADGATSTALCMRALTMMAVESVDFIMPDRFIDGYGLSRSIAARIVERKPDCVITVDNGIASHDGVALLRENDIKVIITDHHLAGDRLPDANVILNQNAWPGETRGKALAGVSVAFYLVLGLRRRLREQGWFGATRNEPNLARLLDLVAIGTIADLVPLDYDNRLLVSQGLERIRAGLCSPGIAALISIAGKDIARLGSTDIAFSLAPRINAAGRLEDISIGVKCLLTDSVDEANALARQLEQINTQRKQIQTQMDAEAQQELGRLELTEIRSRFGLVLFRPEWHEGLVGIIAAKLRERYHRPSIVFAQSVDGMLKGSGRSIAGIHLRDMLDQVDRCNPGLIEKFGGHAMAAGLSIEAQNLTRFEDCFNRVIGESAPDGCFDPVIDCDGTLDANCHCLEFAHQLFQLTPWGQHFPLPSFIGEFEVLEQRVLSERHLKMQLVAPGDDLTGCEAIAFFQPRHILEKNHQRIKIHYELGINYFRGVESLQLLIRHIL